MFLNLEYDNFDKNLDHFFQQCNGTIKKLQLRKYSRLFVAEVNSAENERFENSLYRVIGRS